MSKQKKEETTSAYQCIVYYTKQLKTKRDRDLAFRKFLSLLEEEKESLVACDIRVNKQRRRIILDSEDSLFTFSFGKRPSTNIGVNDPEKNKASANQIGNKVVTYLNSILGDVAIGSKVASSKTLFHPMKQKNLAEKLLGVGRIAKINELVKQAVRPFSISFEYKLGEKNFIFTSFCPSEEGYGELIISGITYKDSLPFDLLDKEITELSNTEGIFKKLYEIEM